MSRLTITMLIILFVSLVLDWTGLLTAHSFRIPLWSRWRARRLVSSAEKDLLLVDESVSSTSQLEHEKNLSWHDLHPTVPNGSSLGPLLASRTNQEDGNTASGSIVFSSSTTTAIRAVSSITIPDRKDVPKTQLMALQSYQDDPDTPLELVKEPAGNDATGSTLHLLILVHGFKGASGDLGYLKNQVESVSKQSLTSSNNKLIVHSAKCNEGLTDDGVQAGGERLVREVYTVMRQHIDDMESSSASQSDDNPKVTNITLSFVGNSMGGLFARYAAARIRDFAIQEYQHLKEKEDGVPTNTSLRGPPIMTVFGRYLNFNVFCSTASPHLGTASHTYIKLPRTLELGLAFALQQTGKDLFRLNQLLYHMATRPYYLDSLASFKSRVAYANAYSTDFMVPTETAAFLNEQSLSEHTFLDTQQLLDELDQNNPQAGSKRPREDDSTTKEFSESGAETNSDERDKYIDEFERQVKYYRKNPLIVAVLQTNQTYVPSWELDKNISGMQPTEESDKNEIMSLAEETDELLEMATALDSLGWKKVFIDLREDMPLKPLRLPGQASTIEGGESSNKNGNAPLTNGEEMSFFDMVLPGITMSTTLWNGVEKSNEKNGKNNGAAPSRRAICQRMQRLRGDVPGNIATSKELVDVLSAKDKISIPLGHNMIVALKKTTTPKIMALFNGLNQRGRPIMDSLANELIEGITNFDDNDICSSSNKGSDEYVAQVVKAPTSKVSDDEIQVHEIFDDHRSMTEEEILEEEKSAAAAASIEKTEVAQR